jgi:hypothetical protein
MQDNYRKNRRSKSGTIRALFGALTILALVGTASAKEALVVSGDNFDFGYVPYHTLIKHRAVLVNQCDTVIKIIKVIPGCGCTQIPMTKDQLAPGESLAVEMILDTGKIRLGFFQKAPVFLTDNRETPRVTVNLSGINLKPDDPPPPIILSPRTLEFRSSQPDYVGAIEITNKGQKNATARLVTGSEYVTIELPIVQIAPGRKQSMTVKLKPGAVKIDKLDESITIVFNDNRQSRFTIPISILR